jgi:hypothetical protein
MRKRLLQAQSENGTEAVNIAAGEGAGESAGQLCIGPDVAQKWWCDKRN